MTTADYRKKLERDRRDRIERADPDQMLSAMQKTYNVIKTQMRTLLWDHPGQLEQALRATPEIGTTFINLVRDAAGNATPPDAKP